MSTNRKSINDKMNKAGIDQRVTDLFLTYYDKLCSGDYGLIYEKDLDPVPYGSLPKLSDLPQSKVSSELLKKTVAIKLNGGLGTSMGLTGPKSFLPVKGEKRFIDIVIDQIAHLQSETKEDIPLILMNSAVTDEQTTALMNEKGDISVEGVPFSFVHNSHPKVLVDDLSPAVNEANSSSEWNPAGHGDIYTALFTSGILDTLLDKGYEYAFISNIDNLGATLNTTLLSYFAEHKFPFLMEVVRRREMDKKGGHIAKDKNGNLILRERAQAAHDEIEAFESTENYSYFNSNTIWVNLVQLKKIIDDQGQIELPLIANKKNLIPTDKKSPEVYQIETAMGSAIALFEGAAAIEIDQNRFRPVKKNDDLLLLWSDRFELNEKGELQEVEGATSSINVELDSNFFATFPDLKKRIPGKIPSLKKCSSLSVKGDVYFGDNVKIIGDVSIINEKVTPAEVSSTILKEVSLKL